MVSICNECKNRIIATEGDKTYDGCILLCALDTTDIIECTHFQEKP